MADFRKYFYALALVALLAGLTAPASALGLPYSCSVTAAVPPPLRAEGWVENVGDLIIDCTGGTPTPNGQTIPFVDISITLSTHITSKITAKVPNIGNPGTTTNFSESIIVADSPNSLSHPGRAVLNCGNNIGGVLNAPDNSSSGPGICSITAPADPFYTYDGTDNTFGGAGDTAESGLAVTTCNGAGGTNAANSYGCGRPNVFQGRQSIVGAVGGPFNQQQVIFLSVPVDQPGSSPTCDPINQICHHIYRITNIRADLAELALGGGAGGGIVSADLTVSNNQLLPIAGQGVIGGSTISILVARFNRSLASPTSVSDFTLVGCANTTRTSTSISFSEIEPDAFKVKNVAMQTANWSPNPATLYKLSATIAAGTAGATYPVDLCQDIPGGAYSTENGFSIPAGCSEGPVPIRSINGPGIPSGSHSFSSGATGIGAAGTVDNGTRIIVNLANIFGVSGAAVSGYANAIAAGAVTVSVPSIVLLKNQLTGATTGVAGLTNFATTDIHGAGSFCAGGPPCTTGTTGTLVQVPLPGAASCVQPTTPLTTVALSACATGQLVYEILFSDPGSFETMTIPFTVSYTSIGLSSVAAPLSPGPIAEATGHYAPWYSATTAPPGPNWASLDGAQQSADLTVEPETRFWDQTFCNIGTIGTTPCLPLWEITGKCTCSLLFPYAVSQAGFDTALEVANTSFDPGPAFGFTGVKQGGPVQFWYYSTNKDSPILVGPATAASGPTSSGNWNFVVPAANGNPGNPAQGNTQCTNELSPGLCPVAGTLGGTAIINPTFVQAGGIMTTNLSSANATWGLQGTPNFQGYVIAQASFQYCHGFAFISGLGLGGGVPTASYVAMSLDNDAPPLTLTGTANIPGVGVAPITVTSTPGGLVPRNGEPGEGLEH